uniref:Uncharacterized protein n=1 Tax=Melittangium lichenicola TaxID=45 RepID=A0A3S7UXF9_9BACT|nr:hypothetical protein [Melittangium lichenicola]
MAEYTVNIFIDSISPAALTVHPGDSVKFQLKRTDSVTVEFNSSAGTPFILRDFGLDGSSSIAAESSQTVVSSASGVYGFKVVPLDRDPPGTLSGDIDVTPDW